MAIENDEVRESPIYEDISRDEIEVQREVICDRDDRITLARELLGYMEDSSGGVYHPPAEYDADGSEELEGVYAVHVRIVPHPTQADDKAKLIVTYKSREFTSVGEEPEDNVLIEESLESASEFITLGRQGLGFGTGVDRKDLETENMEAPAAVNHMAEWVYTLHNLLEIPTVYFDLMGKVNSAAVYSRALDMTFPAETLLCGNPSANREVTFFGARLWRITFRFMYKNNGTIAVPKGWNHFPRTDTGAITFEKLTDSEDAEIPIYTLADFSGIVR